MDFLDLLPWLLCAVLAGSLALAAVAWWRQLRSTSDAVAAAETANRKLVASKQDADHLRETSAANCAALADLARSATAVLSGRRWACPTLDTLPAGEFRDHLHVFASVCVRADQQLEELSRGGLAVQRALDAVADRDSVLDAFATAVASGRSDWQASDLHSTQAMDWFVGTLAEIARSVEHTVQSEKNAVAARTERVAEHVLRSLMQRVQSLATQQQDLVQQLQYAHGDNPEVVADLMRVDVAISVLSRYTQAITVVCGGPPGHARGNTSLEDVVRGAQSRIRDHERVTLSRPSQYVIQAVAVESVAMLLAELLDNATRLSNPKTVVVVSFKPASKGVTIAIDDAGPCMPADQLADANRILSGEAPPTLEALGDPPRIGLPVVAKLAQRHGIRVALTDSSPYGGITAVVLVPRSLLAQPQSVIIEPPEPIVVRARPARAITTAHAPQLATSDSAPPVGVPSTVNGSHSVSVTHPHGAGSGGQTPSGERRAAALGGWQRRGGTGLSGTQDAANSSRRTQS